MKQWVQKLVSQLDYGWGKNHHGDSGTSQVELSEDRATLLYIIDIYNKNLVEISTHPVRRVREIMDEFTRELVNPDKERTEKVLFRLRQFISSYRVSEYTYIRKTFDDFKSILWDFVDQLAEDFKNDEAESAIIKENLDQLREAVEADSIDELRQKSREFIDFYIETQSRKESSRDQKMTSIKKNLTFVKKQLVEANRSMREDHLTHAFNRKSFDEQIKQIAKLAPLSALPPSLIILDIDFFKKINDNFGHDVGDFVLKECVKLLHGSFNRETDFVARIGGEEFAVVLPDHPIELAAMRANEAMDRIRKEVFIQNDKELRFTVSMGISQLGKGETTSSWLKRADLALYNSKNTGRNKVSLAEKPQGEAA